MEIKSRKRILFWVLATLAVLMLTRETGVLDLMLCKWSFTANSTNMTSVDGPKDGRPNYIITIVNGDDRRTHVVPTPGSGGVSVPATAEVTQFELSGCYWL